MAYGVLRFVIRRKEQIKLTTAVGTGLLCQPAEWKGMGHCGYFRPPSFTLYSCLGYLLLSTVFLAVSGMQSSKREGCNIQHCSDSYELAKQELDIKGPGPHEGQAMCMAIRTYKECMVKLINSCNGDLMFYTARNFIQKTMTEYRCEEAGPRINSTMSSRGPVPALCDYHGKGSTKLCVLFGDPHLRTFSEEFQTCKVRGAWPLLSNDYLTVQVTNNPVEGTLEATATSKLTVIVKGNPECTSRHFQTYQAQTYQTQTYSLPETFEDGGVVIGPYHSLELMVVDPGRHVEIHIRYIRTVVVIRQIGRYFTFSISMPEELFNQSSRRDDLQLCVQGCPHSELINYQEFLAQRRRSVSVSTPVVQVDGTVRQHVSRSQAEHICRSAKLVDFYFDSCVFDLLTTGDQNFTLSAIYALRDVVKLDPSLVKYMSNRTSLDLYDRAYRPSSGQPGGLPHACSVLLLLIISLLCAR